MLWTKKFARTSANFPPPLGRSRVGLNSDSSRISHLASRISRLASRVSHRPSRESRRNPIRDQSRPANFFRQARGRDLRTLGAKSRPIGARRAEHFCARFLDAVPSWIAQLPSSIQRVAFLEEPRARLAKDARASLSLLSSLLPSLCSLLAVPPQIAVALLLLPFPGAPKSSPQRSNSEPRHYRVKQPDGSSDSRLISGHSRARLGCTEATRSSRDCHSRFRPTTLRASIDQLCFALLSFGHLLMMILFHCKLMLLAFSSPSLSIQDRSLAIWARSSLSVRQSVCESSERD